MKARSLAVLVLLAIAMLGCRGKTTFTIEHKTAEEWAQELKAEKSSDRTNAMQNLTKICRNDADAVPLLAEGLKDPESVNRRTAIGLLGSLGPQAKAAVPSLQAAAAADPSLKGDVQTAIQMIEAGQ